MKILHVSPSFFPRLGGVETHVAAICSELLLAGHEVRVLTITSDSSLAKKEVVNGIAVIRGDVSLLSPRSLTYKMRIWKWIWQQRSIWLKADVIQVHDVFWWMFPFIFLLHHNIFTTFHGWETIYPVSWSAKLQRYCWSFLSRGTIHVGAWIQEFYWDTPTAITYGGVEMPKQKNQLNPPTTLQKIVFLGRLSAENEVEKYIDLFMRFKERFPKLEITWVGDGPYREKCAATGLVTGMIENPDTYIKTADFVGASSYLSILLAQSWSKVCLSFYSHELKKRYLETMPSSRAMVIKATSQEMEKSVYQLLNNQKLCLELSTLANQSAHNLSWKKVTQQYLSLWSRAGIL